jgi:hypothetical protein
MHQFRDEVDRTGCAVGDERNVHRRGQPQFPHATIITAVVDAPRSVTVSALPEAPALRIRSAWLRPSRHPTRSAGSRADMHQAERRAKVMRAAL